MTQASKVIEFSPRLFERLQQENTDLRKRMKDMIETIRMNEKIHLDFSRIEAKILESGSIEDLVRILVSEIKKRFKIEFVSLSLALDGEENFAKTKGEDSGRSSPRNLLTISTGKLRETFQEPPAPILKAHFDKGFEIFFPKKGREKIGSCAILPLRVRKKWIGSLNFGSGKKGYYGPNQATDLLETLSKKVAVLVDYLFTHQLLDRMSVSAHQKTSSDKGRGQSATNADGEGKKPMPGSDGKILVAAGAVIRREDGKVLFVKQVPEMDNYWQGKWICPGGRVEPGETIEEAVLREVEEETHLQINLIRPLLPFERIVKNEKGVVLLHVIYIDYLAKMIGGELRPDDDVGEAVWLEPGEIRDRLEELHEDTQKLLMFAGIL